MSEIYIRIKNNGNSLKKMYNLWQDLRFLYFLKQPRVYSIYLSIQR